MLQQQLSLFFTGTTELYFIHRHGERQNRCSFSKWEWDSGPDPLLFPSFYRLQSYKCPHVILSGLLVVSTQTHLSALFIQSSKFQVCKLLIIRPSKEAGTCHLPFSITSNWRLELQQWKGDKSYLNCLNSFCWIGKESLPTTAPNKPSNMSGIMQK